MDFVTTFYYECNSWWMIFRSIYLLDLSEVCIILWKAGARFLIQCHTTKNWVLPRLDDHIISSDFFNQNWLTYETKTIVRDYEISWFYYGPVNSTVGGWYDKNSASVTHNSGKPKSIYCNIYICTTTLFRAGLNTGRRTCEM